MQQVVIPKLGAVLFCFCMAAALVMVGGVVWAIVLQAQSERSHEGECDGYNEWSRDKSCAFAPGTLGIQRCQYGKWSECELPYPWEARKKWRAFDAGVQ